MLLDAGDVERGIESEQEAALATELAENVPAAAVDEIEMEHADDENAHGHVQEEVSRFICSAALRGS